MSSKIVLDLGGLLGHLALVQLFLQKHWIAENQAPNPMCDMDRASQVNATRPRQDSLQAFLPCR